MLDHLSGIATIAASVISGTSAPQEASIRINLNAQVPVTCYSPSAQFIQATEA